MKKFLSICLCIMSLLAVLCLPAEARIVIGILKSSPVTATDQLASALSGIAAEEVQIRQFDSEAALTNWLVRFQELDTAIVPPGYVDKQPAGTLRRLADLHLQSAATPLPVVSLRTLGRGKIDLIKNALLNLGKDSAGQKALSTSKLSAFTLPGEKPKRPAVAPKPVAPKPAPAKPAPAKPAPTKPELKPSTALKPEKPAAPAKKEPAKEVTPAEEKVPTQAEAPPAPQPAAEEEQAPSETKESVAPEPAREDESPQAPLQTAEEEKPPEAEALEAAPTPSASQQPEEQALVQKEPVPQAQKPPISKRLILFIVLVIIVAILLKVALVVMRWQSRQRVIKKSVPPPTGEEIQAQETPVSIGQEQEQAKVEEPEPLIIESGFLGPGKVPALLKRCADLPAPVVLQVSKGACEKLIYFAGGQVAGAMTQNASLEESGIRWNKLGSMLLREEFITREERDQAMALLSREPNLRFGEALLKLGYISLAELRHALTRQAKITIYSLILFPEGKYNVFSEESGLPAEESVALEVTNLIREASHHQSEWMSIREALPNLNKALDFTPQGKTKLEQVNLSVQQQEILSLVDGKRSINELSANSAMMDYEVYRFLYMMVKAGVLQ